MRADRRTERHHRRGSHLLKALCQHRVGIDVRQHNETFFDENLGRLERLDGVWQQITWIGMDFEFHPVRKPGGDGQSGKPHGFLGIHGPARVRKKQVTILRNELEDVGEGVLLAGEVCASQSDGDDLASTGGQGVAHEFAGSELPGAEHEPGAEGAPGDDEGLVIHSEGD